MGEIARAQIDVGHLDTAITTAQAIAEPSERTGVLESIAARYLCDDQACPFDILREAMMQTAKEVRRGSFLAKLAGLSAKYASSAEALTIGRLVLDFREWNLPRIIEAMLQAKDRTFYKELLIPCAAHRESAWAVCGLLAQAYPEQIADVARVAHQFAVPRV